MAESNLNVNITQNWWTHQPELHICVGFVNILIALVTIFFSHWLLNEQNHLWLNDRQRHMATHTLATNLRLLNVICFEILWMCFFLFFFSISFPRCAQNVLIHSSDRLWGKFRCRWKKKTRNQQNWTLQKWCRQRNFSISRIPAEFRWNCSIVFICKQHSTQIGTIHNKKLKTIEAKYSVTNDKRNDFCEWIKWTKFEERRRVRVAGAAIRLTFFDTACCCGCY